MLKRLIVVVVAGIVVGDAPAGHSDSRKDSEISQNRYLQHVQTLASDGLQGRGNGTRGLELAADYIAEQFRAAGLSPGRDGSWFQPFEIVTGLEVGEGNRLVLLEDGERHTLELGRSYYPLSVSVRAPTVDDPSAPEGLPVAFAGYGVSAQAFDYDDYVNLDAAGKAIIVFTHEPQENDANSRFEGRRLTEHASVMQKAAVARKHGVKAVLLVVDPAHGSDEGGYEAWLRDPQAEDYGLSVFRIERDTLERALGEKLDLDAVAKSIDSDLRPRSRVLDGLRLQVVERFDKIRKTVRNVVGILEGSHPRLASEAVVIGAHYDHLGLGGRHSMATNAVGEVHNGADDNASGTAALMELARAAVSRRRDFRRTLVFTAFAGEELGLLGSAHYVEHPAVPIERTIAMINLDMIGRPRGRILVSGLESAPDLTADLTAAGRGRAITVKTSREGTAVASSDDASFNARRVPALAFFSGFHGDYHRPSDDWQKIDVKGAVEVTRIALALTERLARRGERPTFVAPPPSSHGTRSGGGGGYGPYFGSVPDFGDTDKGVKFADIRPGSPADKAGLRRGDVLVQFDGQPIATLYDFTFALRSKQPGDKVRVVVIREGKEITADVELVARQ
jgi:hypothetical protein